MITAQEARKLSDKLDISEYISYIDALIVQASEKGETNITLTQYPYCKIGSSGQDRRMEKVQNTLVANGYIVEHTPPFDQRDTANVRISW